jgi:hypothetical protein
VNVTVWRLKDSAGVETRCVLEHVGTNLWELRVERGAEVINLERYPSDNTALARANTMWVNCLLDGWTEL